MPKKILQVTCDIKTMIKISKTYIDFGVVLPGQSLENDFEIYNKTNENLILRM